MMKINNYINIIQEKIILIRYILLKIFDMGIGFLLNLYIVKKLTGYDYGVYTLILTVLGVLITFGFSWTSSSLMYFGVEEKLKYGSLNRTFWARNIVLLVSYVIVGIIFLIFSKEINLYLTESVSVYLFIWMTIRIFTNYLSSYFLAIEKREISIFITLSIKMLVLIFLFMVNVSLKKLLLISIYSEFLGLVWILKINKSDFGKYIFDKDIFKQVLSFGLWQLFGFSGLYLINFGDNIIIKHYLNIQDVGVYNISYQLFMGMAAFSYIFSNYFAPQVVKGIKERDITLLKNIFIRDRFLIVLLLLIPHMFVIIFAKQIIVSFYGSRYINAVWPLVILTIQSIFEYYTVFNMIVFNCFKKYSILQVFNIFQAILNILFDILFIPKWGISGAAYGTFLSFFILAIIKTWYAERILREFQKEVLKR